MESYISMQAYHMLTRSNVFDQLLRQHPIIGQYANNNPDEFKNIISSPNFLRNVVVSGSVLQNLTGLQNPLQIAKVNH